MKENRIETPHYSVGILIPTYQAEKHLSLCLSPLLKSPLKPKILVIDSSSTDRTVEIALKLGVDVYVIPKDEFNHGLTREKGRKLLNTDIVVMITQDAYASSSNMIENLVLPLLKGEASFSYARQIPHLGSELLEAFPRSFNYPPEGHIRSLKDIDRYGVYTFFSSNSCAAYFNKCLDEIGGFPSVLFGEDTIVTAKLLHRHHKIAYVASAEVHHSHSYTLKQEFKRHFDIGLSRHTFASLIAIGGKDSSRGKKYLQALLKELSKKKPLLIPYALVQTFVKLSGYKLGQLSVNKPNWFKRLFSSYKGYWK